MNLRDFGVGLLFVMLAAALSVEAYVILQISSIKQESILLKEELVEADSTISSKNAKIRDLESKLSRATNIEGEYAQIIALNGEISALDGKIITLFQRVNTHLSTAVQLISQGSEAEAQAQVQAANDVITEINILVNESNRKIAEVNTILTELMGSAATKEI